MNGVTTPLSISLTAVLAASVEGGARPALLDAVARAEEAAAQEATAGSGTAA